MRASRSKLLRYGLVAAGALVLVAASVVGTLRYAPDRYDPFAPLVIDEAPSLFTAYKLRRLEGHPVACFEALDLAGVAYTRIADHRTGPGCGFRDAAALEKSAISWGGEIRLTCPMLAALSVWERHDVQPAAERVLGSRVVRIRHFGSYACRNVNGIDDERRSEHATANAVDVAGFVLADGREVSVLGDWNGRGARGRFLRVIHDAACRRFATVLGPGYNALHANHFHLDMGRRPGLCR